MPPDNRPSLYGLTAENSSRVGKNIWGKNQFNATFPLALCLYMRDKNIKPVSVTHDGSSNVSADQEKWGMSEVIGEGNVSYAFEAVFEPYECLSRNKVEKIDLVVSRDNKAWRPLEIKLAVVPDVTTASKTEDQWGPEMVIRPVSSAYALMGLARSLGEEENKDLRKEVIRELKSAYNKISDWGNVVEISSHKKQLIQVLSAVLRLTSSIQSPFLLQPIWRTEGQSLKLSEDCFDVFVWSNLAMLHLPIAHAQEGRGAVTRCLREVARHVRALYDTLSTKDFDYRGIYGAMPLGHQTDKSFSIAGNATCQYINHERLKKPIISKDCLDKIILNGGQNNLRPERRLDAAVVAHFG